MISPRALAALLAIVFTVVFHPHLAVTAGGLTVSVFIPAAVAVALALAVAAALLLAVRSLRGFRSSPHPRTVT